MLLAWNPFDPVGSFKDVLVDMADYMLKQFEQVIVHPPRFSDDGILPSIYGSGNQLTLYIAWIVLLFAVFIGLMFFRKGGRIGMALVNWLLLSSALPVWVTIVNQMSDAGDKGSEAALLIGQNLPENGHFGLPVLDNVGWYILCLLGGIGWGSLLSTFIASYEFLIILLKFWGPIAYAVGTIGTRAKQFSNMILSLGLVATLVGRPFAIFFLELGQVAVKTTPLGKVGFFAMAFVVGSYVAAFASQIVLFFVCYKGVSAIEGFIGARIRGTAETVIRQTIRVDVQNIRKNNTAGLRPVPVPVPVSRGDHTKAAASYAKREGAKAAARKATTVVSAAAMAAGQPEIAVVANKAGGQFFKPQPYKGPNKTA
jgi:hypothetical protein